MRRFGFRTTKQTVFVSFEVGDNDEESAEEQEDSGYGPKNKGQESAGGHRCTMRRDRYVRLQRIPTGGHRRTLPRDRYVRVEGIPAGGHRYTLCRDRYTSWRPCIYPGRYRYTLQYTQSIG